MPKRAVPPPPARPALVLFTTAERELIRREFHTRFGQDPSVADGIMLRTWRGGPSAGQPKLPPAVQSLLERGLVELHMDGRWPTAQFTPEGLAALRELAQDRRAWDSPALVDTDDAFARGVRQCPRHVPPMRRSSGVR